MDYRLIQTKDQRFLAIANSFSNEIINDESNHDIPDFWDECGKLKLIERLLDLRPDGKKDYVNSIELTDDSVQTPEGAYIGMTAEQVKGVYGAATEETSTLLSYTDGNTTLTFVLKDARVISIQYLPM